MTPRVQQRRARVTPAIFGCAVALPTLALFAAIGTVATAGLGPRRPAAEAGTATSTLFWTISRTFTSCVPPYTCRMM